MARGALAVAHGFGGDLQLGPVRTPRELFDRVAIPVAGGEVHRGIVAARSEHLVDQADALEELRPVERGHQPHAHDDVPHGHVHRGLPLLLDQDDLVGGRPLTGQALVQPEQRRGDRGILIAQPLDELHRERRHQPSVLERGEGRRHRLHGRALQSKEIVGERVGRLACRSPADDGLGQASQILDEQDPQGDRDRPQLSDRQRLHALVGVHEPAERLGIEAAVRMGDERPGDAVHARVAGQRPLGQFGELAVKTGRQVVADLAQLFVHDVEVVDQPFRRRRDPAFLADGLGDHSIRLAQEASVSLHP